MILTNINFTEVTDMNNDWQYSQDDYIAYLRANVPECREDFMAENLSRTNKPFRKDVLNFIADFLYTTGAYPVSLVTVFTSGYCYHFACILQHEFGGNIRWVKNRSHMVWEDETGMLYDIEGIFELTPFDIVFPLEELDRLAAHGEISIDGLEEYRHRYLKFRPDYCKE